ncbi:esterase/lipase family protein [Roseateles terrae]|uniref:Pimeloyl-ACP methyl ester carboxylesterase n=1 Tax=Roseateles terrae TaxID=431060 RepID=A0ABR6H045_9BURK|nr:alpha/beta hydrolase [Roseateles terrae]MBB3197292.1 pimeloyl-ACP methyl ester carboxylesterase [Roseateles terrae]
MQVDQTLWAEVAAQVAPPLAAAEEPVSSIQQRRRRGYQAAVDDDREVLELVKDDGVLRWVWSGPQAREQAGIRRAYRSVSSMPRDLVQRMEYRPPGVNRITAGLEDLDRQLNPSRGLRRWMGQDWQAVDASTLLAPKGRVLLLVHGTFSRSEMYSTELTAPGWTEQGTPSVANAALWADWTKSDSVYDAVLAFDHATLSVAPWLNAIDLIEDLKPLADKGVTLDVVCHSRGGLVVAWALRLAALPVSRVVFVGSPLVGTSLAAPDRLSAALDMLANVADALGGLSKGVSLAFPPAMPLALGAAGLAKIVGRTLKLGAALPVADVVVGAVPGLMAQSRVANSPELVRLFPLPTAAALFGVGGEFKPDEVQEPVWKFWKRFSNLADQAKYYGADIVFGQRNDLVVDVDSMNQLGSPSSRLSGVNWCDLGPHPRTHHCSYFRDERTIDMLRMALR